MNIISGYKINGKIKLLLHCFGMLRFYLVFNWGEDPLYSVTEGA